MNDFHVGDVVVMIDASIHDRDPKCYPKAGTLGRVQEIDDFDVLLVAWETGSTTGDDTWFIGSSFVRRIKNDN